MKPFYDMGKFNILKEQFVLLMEKGYLVIR